MGHQKIECISLEHTESNEVIANRFCKLFIVRLYEIMMVTVWQIAPPPKKKGKI